MLRVLLGLILALMALGAGVRAMNAGLSCPDWPLCFGQVVPDFHPGVYFEFVHRAYAGFVALVFLGCCAYVFYSKEIARGAKIFAACGLFVLALQIVMGGLTVLKLIKNYIVTSHLMLATAFFCSVLWISFAIRPNVQTATTGAVLPRWMRWTVAGFVMAIVVQIALGGFVASTYAGLVCVDWPLCNGQWFPTWQGAIGLQILHRMVAYGLAGGLLWFAWFLSRHDGSRWKTKQILLLSRWNAAIVLVQVAIGALNLLWFIPPALTVLHQSVAIVLLAVHLRLLFIVNFISRERPSSVLVNHDQKSAMALPC